MLDNVEQELREFAHRVVNETQKNLRHGVGGTQSRPSGALYKSVDLDLDVHENSFSLAFEMLDYGLFKDRGVRGKKEGRSLDGYSYRTKMPPRDPLMRWINKKRLRLKDDKGRFVKGGAKSLAFLIQRKIFRDGHKPSLFFTKPFEKHFKRLDKDLQEAYALDIEQFFEFTTKGNL